MAKAKSTALAVIDHTVPPGSNLEAKERLLLEATASWGESYFRIGTILRSIYTDGDYKDANYTSFEEYMNDRQPLGMLARQGRQFMAAAERRKLLPDLVDLGDGEEPMVPPVWTERAIRPLTHKDFKPSDVRRLGKKIATRVKRGERLTGSLVKSICDADRGVERQEQEKKAKVLRQTQTPAQALRAIKVEVKLWQSSLGEFPADFWSDAEADDPGCVKDLIGVLSELVSFLRS